MSGPATDDTVRALDLDALRAYIGARAEVRGGLTATRLAGGKSNLTFRVADEAGTAWVVRRPPLAGLTPSAHDMTREYRVTCGLAGSGVPVAPAVGLCEDESVIGAPFTVMGFVEGDVVRTADELAALPDADIAVCTDEMMRVLAALHAVDYESAGLGDFGRPDGYLERQAKRWLRQWEYVATGDLRDVEVLGNRLLERIPASPAPSIVHGDYRIDNVMLAPRDSGRIVAVVDWELSTLGDPISDVAMMCAYRHAALDSVLGFPAAWTQPRIPQPQDLAERYALATGADLPHWDFYMGLAYFKIGVIAAGIAHRTRAGAAAGEDHAAAAVPEYISLGLAALAGNG
ncbi:phosphotransferase family protein [Tomitella fengzijianii]|uniref:Phosphotransferase family protein n=1 Tax=Tomitella fengzijianii TaxID=2597660 RepID=A0A516WYX8_9ACTN|nr:phosphotransferase family protein [Tomitella fengzijianii]QDQ96049.1 phosphotransferase family protein [Tomitella fengzijianii]